MTTPLFKVGDVIRVTETKPLLGGRVIRRFSRPTTVGMWRYLCLHLHQTTLGNIQHVMAWDEDRLGKSIMASGTVT